MDTWSSIIMVVNILLLVAGWLLFQQAKSDLTARAAQIPVLEEVRALQRSVAALLERLTVESCQISAQLDARCTEARDILATLDAQINEIETVRPSPRPHRRSTVGRSANRESALPIAHDETAVTNGRDLIYVLADQGLGWNEIAQQTGQSVGEVELILGLRGHHAG